jgi:glycosyltransferase involved in cell wall biosynthesis
MPEYPRHRVRALVVTSMYPSPANPGLGSFVRDQVQALRKIGGVDLEVFAFSAGGAKAWAGGAVQLARHHRGQAFDIVHAHFGLSTWPALAAHGRARAVTLHGTDLAHPRSRAITLAGLRTVGLVGAVSQPLAGQIPGWAVAGRRLAVLPCGVDMIRFRPLPRAQARESLGLDPAGPYLLFASDPARSEKRYDRALQVAGDVPLLALRRVAPEQVPLWVNAANAVLVPSEREGFGLAALEALACEVPVLATPVGIHPEALRDVDGTLCAPFDAARWRAALEPHLSAADPRVEGRGAADRFSADRMAARLLSAWQELLDRAP